MTPSDNSKLLKQVEIDNRTSYRNGVRRRRTMRWLIGLLLACSILWLGRYQIRHLLFGVKPPSKNSPAGEWVGQIDINGGYVPAKMGDTPGPHKKAAIYFKLSVEDGFMDEYVDPGELYIQGE